MKISRRPLRHCRCYSTSGNMWVEAGIDHVPLFMAISTLECYRKIWRRSDRPTMGRSASFRPLRLCWNHADAAGKPYNLT